MGGVAIVVFSDLVDSTELLARLGDDRMERVRRSHLEEVSETVGSAGGRLIKTLGDGAMASFESALGALEAAAGIQAGVERLNAAEGGIGLAARVGVAAGEPIADGDDLHGMAVVIASRLSSAAAGGEVLVQDIVQALVASRDGVALDSPRGYELKGVPTPVQAARLRWREQAGDAPADASIGAGADCGGGPDASSAGAPPPKSEASPPGAMPLPVKLAAYAGEPLIGRDREIAMLREQTAPRPGRRAVLILGEPGIGKTRHAAAAAAEAHAGGATVVLARCPQEAVVPFEPWVRAIGELALAGDEEWREGLAEAAGPELSALVPELDRHAGPDERIDAGRMVAAEGARYRLLRGMGAALAHASGSRPLHLVLDDAHWCDPASAQALAHLLDGAPIAELVLVVTARDAEMGRGHPVSRALSELRRTGDLSELRLTGLDAPGMVALVGARVGRAITPALAARLQARTSGNPFFAGELARDLDDRGALRDDEALDAAPVPAAVADLVEERLGRLDPSTERLLTAVAAIGPSAPVALAAKAAGLDDGEARRAVREALSERLVDDLATRQPTISFTHALVRDALLSEIGEAERARLHLAIAEALEEDPGAEPAELALHRGLCVELTGPEPAIVAYRAAAEAAAESHDHEGAATHLRKALSLLAEDDPLARAPAFLALGEQELLAADLVRARESFRAACDTARATGDAGTFARAALGFAGGDIGFGWESGADDPAAVALLREGLEALGDDEPRLALRMVFRLVYLLIFSDDSKTLSSLAERGAALEKRIGGAEARVLAGFTALTAKLGRNPDPLDALDLFAEMQRSLALLEPAEECGREDLLFRVVQWSATVHYAMARVAECEQAIERAAEIAARLGSPRFTWEVDLYRGLRRFDRGDREGAEALLRRAGAVMRRLRPDLHIFVELTWLVMISWLCDGESEMSRLVYEAMEEAMPGQRGLISAGIAATAAWEGDHETARSRLRAFFENDLESLPRRPDCHLPMSLGMLAYTASRVGDREAGERLRPLFEPLRSHVAAAVPSPAAGFLPEWAIGNLELLAGRPDDAVTELREAVAGADELGQVWTGAWYRMDLARALQRSGDGEEALSVLAEGESIARRYGVGLASRFAAEVRAEIEGRAPPPTRQAAGAPRPIRRIATRGRRRALATTVRGLDDVELEARFAEPRRQRALLKGMARGFQPAGSGGFDGVVAYELEPFAIEPPPDAPWRWAIEVDSRAGRARLREPAPLDAAVTIHFGLAEWVRVAAGAQDPLGAMVSGRCSVEGDVMLAARLPAMFGIR
jgi:class 3 adenylate cyclase/tetratricopeptide (TPR) repeat protein